jgi:hypothetical protein
MIRPSSKQSPARRTWSAVSRGLVLLMLVSLTACSGEEDDELIRPDGKWGIIEGYVLGGGQPVAADVSVRQLGHAELDGTFETRSDSSGWYSLMVPAGNYRLGAENLYYAAAGICLSWRDADTVITTCDRVRADFL